MKQHEVDVLIVGAGLFGSVIRDALGRQGMDVMTIDDHRPMSGSTPAACLMKPSWFSGLGPKVYNPALELLSSLYTMHELEFQIAPAVKSLVYWIHPGAILTQGGINRTGRVTGITPNGDGRWLVSYLPGLSQQGSGEVLARRVVVACGIWTSELAPVDGLEPRVGAAWIWQDPKQTQERFINVWAPYRQIVAFHRDPGELWVGDGTALKAMSMTNQQRVASRQRCASAVGRDESEPRELAGIRPYVKGAKPAYLQEHMPGLWVATGGAKNGTLAAGWCAKRLVEALS